MLAICALLFENGCSKLFLLRVKEYWRRIEDEEFLDNLQNRVAELVIALDIKAIFCDEVHTLQSKFVGEFCHTSPPDVPWADVRRIF